MATKFVMLIGGVLSGIAMIGVTAVLPQIEADLARTVTDMLLVKMLGPVIGLSMVFGAPLTGFLFDRIGARRIFIAGCLVYAIAGSSGLYLTSLYGLLASRLLVGLAAAAIVIVSMTLINKKFDGVERARWMGFHVSSAMLCSLAVHPVLGLLGELGWRWPFLIYLLGLLAAAVGMAMPRDRLVARAAPLPSVAPPPGPVVSVFSWFPVRYIPLALIIGGIVYMPMVYFPFVVREFGVSSPAIISFIMLADAIIGTIVSFFYGFSRRYISTRGAFIMCFGFTGMGMSIVAFAPDLVFLVGGMLVYGLGIGWFTANLMTSVSQNVSAEHQARAVGIIKAAHFISAPAAVLAVEPITRAVGPMGSIWAGAGLSLFAVTLFVIRASGAAFHSWSRRAEPIAAE